MKKAVSYYIAAVVKSQHTHTPGTPALTSRGMKEAEIAQVTEFLHQGITLTQQTKTDHEASVKEAASGGQVPAKPTTKV